MYQRNTVDHVEKMLRSPDNEGVALLC